MPIYITQGRYTGDTIKDMIVNQWDRAHKGENGAKMIRQAQCDKKGVSHRAGAEHRRQDDVADEAGDPREQREAADREDALDHRSMPPG